MPRPTQIESNPDGHLIEYTPLELTLLEPLLRELFERRWRDLVIGYCIQGAVFELRATQSPRLSLLDGYLTVDFGSGHLHLCIGAPGGLTKRPTPTESGDKRPE